MSRILSLFTLCACMFVFSTCDSNSDTNNPTDPTTGTTTENYQLVLKFTGTSLSSNTVYACWIEDESGKDIQNVYVCDRIANASLTGDALPYWTTVKHIEESDIDGVTGASTQGDVGLSVTRTIPTGSPTKFRVCFEIDRSLNNNDYFGDRPSFIYRSDIIDVASLTTSPYNLTLYGWMANGTDSGTYSQKPNTAIPGYATYKLMTDLTWIANSETDTANMVSLLAATVSKP